MNINGYIIYTNQNNYYIIFNYYIMSVPSLNTVWAPTPYGINEDYLPIPENYLISSIENNVIYFNNATWEHEPNPEDNDNNQAWVYKNDFGDFFHRHRSNPQIPGGGKNKRGGANWKVGDIISSTTNMSNHTLNFTNLEIYKIIEKGKYAWSGEPVVRLLPIDSNGLPRGDPTRYFVSVARLIRDGGFELDLNNTISRESKTSSGGGKKRTRRKKKTRKKRKKTRRKRKKTRKKGKRRRR
jgi:hypothetical protein